MFLNGVSSFIVGASFNRNNVYNSTCKVYLRKTTEVHCGLGDCSEDKIYENAINSLQKDWNYDFPCFPSAQVLFTATSMNWSWPVECQVKSTLSFYYANHTQQRLVSRWGAGKHALQTIRSSMRFKKVAKLRK